MKFFPTTLFLFLLLLFSNCEKKKYPDTLTLNSIEFYSELNFSTGKVLLEAGKNNYRLFSSHFLNIPDSLYHYISDQRNKDCNSNCVNSFKIEIIGDKKNIPESIPNMNTELHIGNYKFASSSWEVKFTSSYNKSAANYLWQFGDGNYSIEKDPIHTYKEGGSYNVCLTITSLNGCISTICNLIDVGFADNNCAASITAVKGSGGLVQFNAITYGIGPFQAFWDFGDGNTSSSLQTSNVYAIRGSYQVGLTLTDATGDKTYANYNVVTSGDSSSCAANFRTLSITEKPEIPKPSRVKLIYRDINGIEYRSDVYSSDENRFEVLSIADFDANEKNEPTKKLEVKFKGRLYNGQNSIQLNDSRAVIAISYKN